MAKKTKMTVEELAFSSACEIRRHLDDASQMIGCKDQWWNSRHIDTLSLFSLVNFSLFLLRQHCEFQGSKY